MHRERNRDRWIFERAQSLSPSLSLSLLSATLQLGKNFHIHTEASRIIIKFRQLIVSVNTYLIYIIIINSPCMHPSVFKFHFHFIPCFVLNLRFSCEISEYLFTHTQVHTQALFAHGYSDKNQSISHAFHVKIHGEKSETHHSCVHQNHTYTCSNKTDIH